MRKKFTRFIPRIKSRHPSHSSLRIRGAFPLFPFKSVIRLGSSTEMPDTIEKGGERVELNTVEAISNSANKLKMKKCFNKSEVKTADWWTIEDFKFEDAKFPVIIKNIFGSRGTGNTKIDTAEDLKVFISKIKNTHNYIIESFYNYNREYRLHITNDGCFYTCRKMIKEDTPEGERWYRNDNNSVWILEDNETFDTPVNWEKVIAESVKALNSVGLDFGAVDLRIQSATNKEGATRKNPKYIIIEINSAPSFGVVTLEKYINELPKLLKRKYDQQRSSKGQESIESTSSE